MKEIVTYIVATCDNCHHPYDEGRSGIPPVETVSWSWGVDQYEVDLCREKCLPQVDSIPLGELQKMSRKQLPVRPAKRQRGPDKPKGFDSDPWKAIRVVAGDGQVGYMCPSCDFIKETGRGIAGHYHQMHGGTRLSDLLKDPNADLSRIENFRQGRG